ncbi:Periplasmic binding protein/LacI transcriptional regulator (plasmid) [Neorhizobium galegae bv. officinalis bv. officinalis str. HAMBI 1141]|jgi:ribose transport system substrate-binding protein|uniref:Periplasmic binding protein/LacI transcriptional regulator n=1 Tax=Neorhizobium galegae bv. officinalis bv. officinalis str. HAMBI 1141 TaxID=1028801 RepID=A0A068TH69_NEOGA|nr:MULTISPECIES: ABC transporter substrate-binding protein [Neorhizobium]MCJ9670836.1 ABC transporter substrate-binding protein [Neorhizobium sp. SHOUNA12B]MCJ9747355.1 ABC transporter substrate-binding protein [Neorhizobium sp. SHOUNA12A]MCJ9752196.1 ABC transporter substrate-binding protein [Neorhizobium sp. BETTINA12A]CDN57371.1 Periplasmic binding protein/LacI transcriptional regulator [Neorhizobium galegae bv. officinalis bv. officinalis str. HAMBI 1141]
MKKLAAALLTSVIALTAFSAQAGEIAVIVKTVNSTFWQNVQKGADAAMKAGGGSNTMTFQGPAAESAIADQVNMVENAVNRKVSGIVLAPSDPDALVPAVKKAWEARIPVVIVDSLLAKGSEQYYQSFLATDNKKAGELAAKALIDKVGKEGKIAVMSYVAGAGSEIGRVGGFTDYIKANSKLTIVGPFYSQSQMATALNQTTDVLAANSDLKGIFGANEPTAIGMGRALKQSGKAGKVVAIGFDGNQDLQEFVKDGTLTAIAVQGSFQMGELGVKTVLQSINKEKVEKFVDTGVVVVTKDNIDKPEAKNVLY